MISTVPSVAYNFPLFLFGSYIQESSEAVGSLKTFTVLLPFSALYDLVSLINQSYSTWHKLLVFLVILLKVPVFFAFASSLRQRGFEIGLGVGGPNLSGPTLWSMPGGFTSTGDDRYQTVDDDASFVRANRPPAPTPSHNAPPMPTPATQAAPGAYQTV